MQYSFFTGITAKYLWKSSPNKLRGKSTYPTTSKQKLFVTLVTTVNYWHKEIYYRYCRGPRYTSETSYYKKFENEQLKYNVKSNKNLVKQFVGYKFSWGAFFRGGNFPGANFPGGIFPGVIFRGAIFLGAFFRGVFFPGAFFRTPFYCIEIKIKIICFYFLYTVQVNTIYQRILYSSCFFLFLRHRIQNTKEHILHKWGFNVIYSK